MVSSLSLLTATFTSYHGEGISRERKRKSNIKKVDVKCARKKNFQPASRPTKAQLVIYSGRFDSGRERDGDISIIKLTMMLDFSRSCAM